MNTLRRAEWSPEALDALRPAERADTSGGLQRVEDWARQGELFEIDIDDVTVMRYVLTVRQHSGGREGIIIAAAGRAPGVDLTEAAIPLIESTFAQAGCAVVALCTRRMGLVKKLARLGYRVDGVILRKRIGGVQ